MVKMLNRSLLIALLFLQLSSSVPVQATGLAPSITQAGSTAVLRQAEGEPTDGTPVAQPVYLPLLINGTAASTAVPEDSTPALIEQAFAKGELTADERTLYLAYALYEPQSLPLRFHSNVGWYGTRYVQQVETYLQQMNAATTDAVQQELSRLTTLAATVCDNEDGANSFNSANFHFNYDAIGGGLVLADYVTSMETTFDVEVTQYGWAAPPLCTGDCSEGANPWGNYPIQIIALGSGLYGYVTIGGNYTGFIGDNPNTAASETDALASCMVLNDDYSQFTEGAQAALDATTAHEFVHSIQFGYGDASANEDDMWYESSAAYMEDEVFDSSNSNYFYLWPVITNSLGEWPNGDAPFGISEYSNFLFFRHVAEHTGGTNVAGGGEEVMQHFWENVAAGQAALTAYNNALITKNTTLADAFHAYAIAAKFSKGCGAGYVAPYCFEEGADYITSAGNPPGVQGTIASSPGSYNGSVKNHYAANWVSLPTTGGPYQVILSNTATGGELRGTVVCDTGTAFTLTAFPSVATAGNSTSLANVNVSGCTSVITVITNQEQTSGNPSAATAQTYTVTLGPAVATPTPTITATSTPVPPTATATNTPTATATNTLAPPTATSTVTNTPVPPTATNTATATATNTLAPPTATATVTNTPVPPTATNTATATATTTLAPPTATATVTNTPVPPTATNTATATATNTLVPPTATSTVTNTPVPPTATNTATATATTTLAPPTATATVTNTPVPPTATATSTATATATTTLAPPTATATVTNTPMPPTATNTATATATNTLAPPTATATVTNTPVPPTATATNTATATATPTVTNTPVLPTVTHTPTKTPLPTATATMLPLLYISGGNGQVGSLSYRNEDILQYDQNANRWSLFFDGSDVGVANANLDAFDLLADGSLLLSFDLPMRFPAIGIVDDADIVKFTPIQMGSTTRGAFTLFFDGSDVGLTTGSEDIDAITYTADEQLLISTYGSVQVSGAQGQDEDLLRFIPTALGATTSGSWARYFDGSAVALNSGGEDVSAAAVDAAGKLYLTTKGNFSATSNNSIQGDLNDIFGCTPSATGPSSTRCTFFAFFDGDQAGFTRPVDGFSFGSNSPARLKPAQSSNTVDEEPVQFEVLPDDPVTIDEEFDNFDAVQLDLPVYLPLVTR